MENQSDLKELLAALCKAQAEYPDIPKTRVGQEGNRKFKYADLNDIHKATRPINIKYGLTTPHETTDTQLITRLYHAPSGQYLSTSLPIKLSDNPKHTGATLTYLKRYNIQSLLDISTEEDLDAIDTSKTTNETNTQPSQKWEKSTVKTPNYAKTEAYPEPPQNWDEPISFDDLPPASQQVAQDLKDLDAKGVDDDAGSQKFTEGKYAGLTFQFFATKDLEKATSYAQYLKTLPRLSIEKRKFLDYATKQGLLNISVRKN